MNRSHDVVVIGAGPAGMMCASQAGRRGRRVVLVEHYDVVGEKIRISGGGRCNFTNVNASPANYLSQNPDFCRSALARYTPAHFVRLRRALRHRVSRKEAGTALLRPLGTRARQRCFERCDRTSAYGRSLSDVERYLTLPVKLRSLHITLDERCLVANRSVAIS
jgi:NADPH-dependent 2,4-dienoyl-CoA reductase/sulfur reductase-like enzyme